MKKSILVLFVSVLSVSAWADESLVAGSQTFKSTFTCTAWAQPDFIQSACIGYALKDAFFKCKERSCNHCEVVAIDSMPKFNSSGEGTVLLKGSGCK